MNAEVSGKEKFPVARAAIESVLARMPEGTAVGLRCYGHRYTPLDKRADEDSELVLPIAPLDRKAFVARLTALRAKGKTPMAFSLEQAAAHEVAALAEGAELTIILLTDGRETDKRRSPAQAARALVAANRKARLKVHVVGFDLKDDLKAHEELEAIAAAGGGVYARADDALALEAGVLAATGRQATYVLRNAAGKEIGRGAVGEVRKLPEGRYEVALVVGEGEAFARKLWINTDRTTRVLFAPESRGRSTGEEPPRQ
jgi:hypothetical protein